MAINRWDPFGSFQTMRDMMDRMVREPMFGAWPGAGAMAPPMEVTEDSNEYQVRLAIPGVRPEDVQIQLEQNVLTINGEMRADQGREGRRTLHQERNYGAFSRSIALPGSIDADKVSAQFEYGVLTVTMPKHEAARPRSIQIQTGGRQTIQGQVAGGGATGGQRSTGEQATPYQENEARGEKAGTDTPAMPRT